MTTRDYYEEARLIADLLSTEGHKKAAASLIEILDAGFSSTEILMGLRFHTIAALNECVELSETTAIQLRNLAVGISVALED